MTRFAVLADIHGNLLALEAVIADMARRNVDEVVNLGDCVSGPLWPAESLALLRRQEWPTVRGNQDRCVGNKSENDRGASDRYAWACLTEEDRDWLHRLPEITAFHKGVIGMHAQPGSDTAYLLEAQEGGRLRRADPGTVASRLGDLDASLVLTAHSHLAGSLKLLDGRWICNPGSVGCPAYDDDSTMPPHMSETGSPNARYAIVETTSQDPMIEFLSVPYRFEEAARKADSAGRPDWAHALRTGFSLWRPA